MYIYSMYKYVHMYGELAPGLLFLRPQQVEDCQAKIHIRQYTKMHALVIQMSYVRTYKLALATNPQNSQQSASNIFLLLDTEMQVFSKFVVGTSRKNWSIKF